jgi:hypothetical protein
LRDFAAADIAWLGKHHRPWSEKLLGQSGICLGVKPALGERGVTGRVDELLELRVRHLVTVDPEAIDPRNMREALLGLMALGAHGEGAAGNERHAGGLAFLDGQTDICGAAPHLRPARVPLFDTGCQGAGNDASQHHTEPKRTNQQVTPRHRHLL